MRLQSTPKKKTKENEINNVENIKKHYLTWFSRGTISITIFGQWSNNEMLKRPTMTRATQSLKMLKTVTLNEQYLQETASSS
jgi:hypothetical protein